MPLHLRAFAVDVLLANAIFLVARLSRAVCSVKAVTIEASIEFEYFAILVTLPDTWQNLLQMSAT